MGDMHIPVEPLDGTELDRMITALLNASGVVHCMIEKEQSRRTDGLEIIGAVARRLREQLAAIPDLHAEEDPSRLTQVLAMAALPAWPDDDAELELEPACAAPAPRRRRRRG